MPRKKSEPTPVVARLLHTPVDGDMRWMPIFDRLVGWIGMDAALAWFGHARVLQITPARIDLATWCAFAAHEALRQYGAWLARAVLVAVVHIYQTREVPLLHPLGGAAGG